MKRLTFILFIILTVVVSGCSSIPKKGRPIEDFQFTNQDGEQVGLEDLKGSVWIADFIFTNCITVCPPMTANMAELQRKVKDEKLDNVYFVSFSVDPEVDTPEALKTYGEAFGADFSTWHFLTGYDQKTIEEFAYENYRTWVLKPKGEDQVIHGISFYLMNKKGEIVAEYPGDKDVPFNQIIRDIKAALKQAVDS